MDQDALVDGRIEDGQKLILQLLQDGFELVVAFWLKAPEDAWPHLFIASRIVEQKGPTEAYRTLQKSLQRLPGTTISLADVKLIGVANHITSSARHILKKAGQEGPVVLRGGQLSNIAVEYAYIYPPPGRQKRNSIGLGQLRLKSAVNEVQRIEETVAPLTLQEGRALEQIVASGVSPTQAEYWVRKKRETTRAMQAIPAGTVVNARVTAWWGDSPDDDPNPLLEVIAPDGTRGLTFKSNTEPV
jgi:hypothetical protein